MVWQAAPLMIGELAMYSPSSVHTFIREKIQFVNISKVRILTNEDGPDIDKCK